MASAWSIGAAYLDPFQHNLALLSCSISFDIILPVGSENYGIPFLVDKYRFSEHFCKSLN